jgi:glyoxylase-like metal-dependent hydrolase (beta-lactamase superfamily II)
MTELADGIWRLDCGSVNAYLVEDRDDLVLFDAGTPRSAGAIREGIAAAGYGVADVDRVLVTHYDLDHVGGLAKLQPELDAPVILREPAASYLTGTRSPSFGSMKGAFQRVSGLLLSRPDLRVERIVDGETAGTFTAYHTPGHTQGHVAYVSKHRDVGVLGDLVRETGGRLERSPWYLSHDTDAVAESVRKLASRAPEFEVACVGHGDPITEGGSAALVRLAREGEGEGGEADDRASA